MLWMFILLLIGPRPQPFPVVMANQAVNLQEVCVKQKFIITGFYIFFNGFYGFLHYSHCLQIAGQLADIGDMLDEAYNENRRRRGQGRPFWLRFVIWLLRVYQHFNF